MKVIGQWFRHTPSLLGQALLILLAIVNYFAEVKKEKIGCMVESLAMLRAETILKITSNIFCSSVETKWLIVLVFMLRFEKEIYLFFLSSSLQCLCNLLFEYI